MGLKARPKTNKLNASTQKSLKIYVEAIHDCLNDSRAKKCPPKDKLGELWTDLDDYPDLDEHLDLQWILGYVAACAEILDVQPETLL
jgi:hypothetical protein